VAWNEKWIYLDGDGRTTRQVVLWNRYDLVGAFRIADDGSARPLEIPGLPDA
jgi:hypothetical protein